jgi:hypothetical protein
MFEDENAPALCEHGCEVEPDGEMLPRLPVYPASRWADLRGVAP